MNELLDKASRVRQGEELDVETLGRYLTEQLPELDGPLTVEQFPSGFSNLTYLIRMGSTELVLRRPPFGSKVKSAHDMGREFRVLSSLRKVYSCAPRPLHYCADSSILGAPFYVMRRIEGVILRSSPPTGFDPSPSQVRALCENFIDNLADLHGLDYAAAGLGDLGKPDGYVRRQVEGWTKRYYGSQTDDIADIETTIRWINQRIPAETGAVLVHNDYKFDNLVLAPNDLTRIIGVLDWEMCTIGDPLTDLATSLAYWVQDQDTDSRRIVSCFLTTLPGAMTRAELARRYADRTGRDVSNLLYYYCFALFKLAVIVQQIYYRYKKGLTRDERFAPLIHSVRDLGTLAVKTVERGKM